MIGKWVHYQHLKVNLDKVSWCDIQVDLAIRMQTSMEVRA
jgi:hypothetical protein